MDVWGGGHFHGADFSAILTTFGNKHVFWTRSGPGPGPGHGPGPGPGSGSASLESQPILTDVVNQPNQYHQDAFILVNFHKQMDANMLDGKQLLTLHTSEVTAAFSVRARRPLVRTHVPVTNAHLHMNTACARACTST